MTIRDEYVEYDCVRRICRLRLCVIHYASSTEETFIQDFSGHPNQKNLEGMFSR